METATAPSNALTLTVRDFRTEFTDDDRAAFLAWASDVIGQQATDRTMEVRIREGWCEFDSQIKHNGRFVVLYTDCPHDMSLVWIRRRVACPLPPRWPMRRRLID